MDSIDPRKRRMDRRPGRSGRPVKPIATHLPAEENARLRAIVKAEGITVFRFLQDAVRARMAEYSEKYSRINPDVDAALAAAGLSIKRDTIERSPDGLPLPRLRERDVDTRRQKRGPPTLHDHPGNLT